MKYSIIPIVTTKKPRCCPDWLLFKLFCIMCLDSPLAHKQVCVLCWQCENHKGEETRPVPFHMRQLYLYTVSINMLYESFRGKRKIVTDNALGYMPKLRLWLFGILFDGSGLPFLLKSRVKGRVLLLRYLVKIMHSFNISKYPWS